MTTIEYILSVDRKSHDNLMTDEERFAAESAMESLSIKELETLSQMLNKEKVLYIKCSEMKNGLVKEPFPYYDPCTYYPYRAKMESFDCLLTWVRDKVKGKLSYAKRILVKNFEGYSYSQQIQILKILLDQAPSDRRFAYKQLFLCWDDQMKDDVVESWKRFHDDECARLITHFFPTAFIKDNLRELSVPRNYYTLCRRLGRESWFKPKRVLFPEDITVRYYLEAMAYTKYPISSAEAREILFRLVSVVIHSILINKEKEGIHGDVNYIPSITETTMAYYFDIRNCDFSQLPNMSRIFVCLCRMGLFGVVEDFIRWNYDLVEHYTMLKTIISPNKYLYGGACIIDILSVAWYLFPKDLAYMLDYESYEESTWLNSNWDVLLCPVPRKNKEESFRLEDKLRILSDDDFDWIPVRYRPDTNCAFMEFNDSEQHYTSEEEQIRIANANPTLCFCEDISLCEGFSKNKTSILDFDAPY